MLARVQRLEQVRRPTSPFELDYGSLDAFEAEVWADINAGKLDSTDMPVVLGAIRRWHSDGVWKR